MVSDSVLHVTGGTKVDQQMHDHPTVGQDVCSSDLHGTNAPQVRLRWQYASIILQQYNVIHTYIKSKSVSLLVIHVLKQVYIGRLKRVDLYIIYLPVRGKPASHK